MKAETEALIIGAGPIGLFQAFELGLLGLGCQIVEALDRPGGQCTELYPDKPIYDIPGTAYTTAEEFIQQLLKQIEPFKTPIHLGQTVTAVNKENEVFTVTTNAGNSFTAQRIFVATGAGAFTNVRLRLDEIHAFENQQVHYDNVDSSKLEKKNVVVTGDNQSAIQTALQASTVANSVVYVHRKRRLDASAELIANLEQAVANGIVQQVKGKITGFNANDNLEEISVQQSAAVTTNFSVDHLLVKLGSSPKQSDLESWGIETSARHIPVDQATFETSTSGIFAIGDINIYAAKRKLILCGFHEATLAAFAATSQLRPDKPLHLQYTTTSSELQKRLGVA